MAIRTVAPATRRDRRRTLPEARHKALRREFFAPKVREHRGRIVKLMGDDASAGGAMLFI